MDLSKLNSHYVVRKISESDLPKIYTLCKGNPLYYKYMKVEPTMKNLRETMTILPSGKTMKDKYFIGFFDGDTVVAILDLILEYPDEQTAYIGWFMVNAEYQGHDVGSKIIEELLIYLEKMKFVHIRLGVMKGNSQAEHFWGKNGFEAVEEVGAEGENPVIVMQKLLEASDSSMENMKMEIPKLH